MKSSILLTFLLVAYYLTLSPAYNVAILRIRGPDPVDDQTDLTVSRSSGHSIGELWAVQVNGTPEDAERVAHDVGFVNLGPVRHVDVSSPKNNQISRSCFLIIS